MPRIQGVDIPNDKKIWISLTYIHGIGKFRSRHLLDELGIDADVRAKDLTEEEITRIARHIEMKQTEQADFLIEGALRRRVAQNIARLREINCYRGLRHRRGLPVRGQRTKTNARTRKGPRKTVATKKSVKTMR